MRFFVLLATSLTLLTACSDDDNAATTPWEIGHSDPATSLTATGTIDQQNARNSSGKKTYTVKEAYLADNDANTNLLRYIFTSNDTLNLIVTKRTQDYNYHFKGLVTTEQNEINYVIFNADTLELKESAVSVQPRADENRFHTVVNVHTLTFGDFNGTVNQVPYIAK